VGGIPPPAFHGFFELKLGHVCDTQRRLARMLGEARVRRPRQRLEHHIDEIEGTGADGDKDEPDESSES
jgi:hypothetical protein